LKIRSKHWSIKQIENNVLRQIDQTYNIIRICIWLLVIEADHMFAYNHGCDASFARRAGQGQDSNIVCDHTGDNGETKHELP